MTHICVMVFHKPILIHMGGLILGVNTFYRLFCFFKLFPMVGKGRVVSMCVGHYLYTICDEWSPKSWSVFSTISSLGCFAEASYFRPCANSLGVSELPGTPGQCTAWYVYTTYCPWHKSLIVNANSFTSGAHVAWLPGFIGTLQLSCLPVCACVHRSYYCIERIL